MVQIVTWNDFGEGTMIEPTVEYGFRDLGIVQEQRRQYIDRLFSGGTNDLMLPLRLYHLRVASSTNTTLKPQLDAVANSLIKGELDMARKKLNQLEPPKGTSGLRLNK
jgi:hypothetical protein